MSYFDSSCGIKTAPSNDAGFSVLEAMIAIAILAAALLPLLALQAQFIRTVESLERAEVRLATEESVRAYLSAINLYDVREGQILSTYGEINWTAKPITSSRAVRGKGGFPSRFDTQLYEVTAQIAYEGNRGVVIKLDGIGWRPKKPVLDGV
ncbi:MAG: prepilin-type N-terminal cleavage/methylation domain-containing protein [Maricaulaceae bacterium]